MLVHYSPTPNMVRNLSDDSCENSDRMFETMALELQQLLIKLSHLHDDLTTAAGADPPAAVQHTLMRHRQILADISQEFNKTKTNIRQSRERADLLGSVQRDISAFHTNGGSRTEYYLKENEQIKE